MNKIVLAADLGGTNLRMAAVDAAGKIHYRTRRDTPRGERADEIVRAFAEAANECRQNISGATVKAVAAAVPGTIRFESGTVLKAPNLPALDGFRMAAALEHELNLPALLENDANAAAIGENWRGASKGVNNSIAVTLGTGVGGGIILDGKIWRGLDGTGGEIGHITVEPFGAPCGCGSRGCVEQYASATAIVRLTQENAARYPKSVLPDKLRLTAADVYEAGKAGDELALEVFRQVGFYLGVALGGLINTLNPEMIVIGGGAAAGWELFYPHLQETILHRAYREAGERARIVRAELGDDAGILGAAWLGLKT
jgi:glucokinase